MSDELPPLLRHLPPAPDPDAVLDGFLTWAADTGIELYEHQEEAALEIVAGNHVIVNTPTGSGKSLIGTAAHFAALADDRRSYYTAPIKALVSEKFFALSAEFGADRVGMITGDAKVNPDAPIICCTAEILANQALRDGDATDVDLVVVDEFHYYADPQRGWAWQVPLLTLPHVQFVLLSATLGPTDFFETDLEARTGRAVSVVRSATRPVPLDFEYRHTTLHASIEELLDSGRAPIYLVHFTQRDATEAAQGYLSLDPLTKDEKERMKEALGGFRFDSPVGNDLRRYLLGGVGVHHAGLLPKYRLLVEKLAQQGLLKIICGTDTLGVGVNVPIRSVVFTQLCKYDGHEVRLLRNREFAQIAGRAGRRGFDDAGTVFVQAPVHVVENLRAEQKAAAKAGGKKKVVKKKPPERGYSHWTEDTFTRMVNGEPEPLTSSFRVNHQLVLSMLDRPGDGCLQLRTLMTDNHEPRRRQRDHIRRTVAIYRSLVDADLLEFLPVRDEDGRFVRVDLDLNDEFALHQPLSLWAVDALNGLDVDDPEHPLRVLSVVESVLESPGVVVAAQVDRRKRELLAELKAAGVEYEERMERLAEVRPPRPDADELYETFNEFRSRHPWVGGDTIRPKSIVREMAEMAVTFREYIQHYGLKRSEGVLLRYLSDVYKGLLQMTPIEVRTDEVLDLVEWLGALVRQVDSSLIDEWEKLLAGDTDDDGEVVPPTIDDITTNERAFRVMVRNEIFRWVQLFARRDWSGLATVPDAPPRDEIVASGERFFTEFDEVRLDGDARSTAAFVLDLAQDRVTQIIVDGDDVRSWRFEATIDRAASIDEGRAVLRWRSLVDLERA